MDPTRAAIVAALLATLCALVVLRARHRAAPFRPARLPEDAFPDGPRAPLTAFYFTSRLCEACQETPGLVRDAAPEIDLVALSVHERPDLVRTLRVFETPTLLLVDAEGRVRHARVGNPTPHELRARVAEARDRLRAEGASAQGAAPA